VSTRKGIVEMYIDGFRRGDLTQILSCLTDDVVWAHGDKTLQGRDAFAAEAANDGGPNPTLILDRLVEEDDSVVAMGHGDVVLGGGDPADFVFCEVFSFAGDAVRRLDTFHVWLNGTPAS
jgi:ketosteroid isomerase-like protein